MITRATCWCPHCLSTYQGKGWMTSAMFTMWLEFLDPHLGDARPVLVLMDQHPSRLTLEAIEFARRKRILMGCFPTNGTSLLQPLDAAVFGAFKQKLLATTSSEEAADSFNQLGRSEMVARARAAYDSTFTPSVIQVYWLCFESFYFDFGSLMLTGGFPKDRSRALESGRSSAPYPNPKRRRGLQHRHQPAVACRRGLQHRHQPAAACRRGL